MDTGQLMVFICKHDHVSFQKEVAAPHGARPADTVDALKTEIAVLREQVTLDSVGGGVMRVSAIAASHFVKSLATSI